jgi:hypothetical protein
MGFIRGVFAGVAVAVGAAAWYMSRAGSKFRDRYRVDRRLGEIGDEIEMRTRDVRATVNAQVAGARERVQGGSVDDIDTTLDEARAAAAEEAAEIAADVEAKAAKIKRAAKDTAAGADAEADAKG